jgi:hypothetical protein
MVAEMDVRCLQVHIDNAAINLTRPAVILDVAVPLYYETKRLVQSGEYLRIRSAMAG